MTEPAGGRSGRLVMKVLSLAVGVPVGIASKRLVQRAWAAARPDDPPREAKQAGVLWGDAIGWAVLSAASGVIAQLVTRRGAEEVWRTMLGTEPPAPKAAKPGRKAAAAEPA
jgi:hypothetical protein